MRYRWGLAMLMVLALATVVQASWLARPMGDYVREADLIVIGDTRSGGDHDFDTVVSVTEVVKGDAKLAGTQIVLSLRDWSTADAHAPSPASGVAVLLRRNWQEQHRYPILEAYSKPEEIAALRSLVAVYRLPGERQQLLALREKALTGDELLVRQLLADLHDMREPGNFDLMADLYDALSPTYQSQLVTIMGEMADPRAVPVLLKALESPDGKVSGAAAGQLYRNFPGAPGVTEAFESALTKKRLTWYTSRYLSKRRDDPALDALRGPETPWMLAHRLWDANDKEKARAAFLALIESPDADRFTIRDAAPKLLPDASPVEKDRIRRAVLPQLTAIARGDNYLEVTDAAQILRALRHPDCLEALLAIVPRTDSRYRRATRTATLAISELGPEARQRAVTALIGNLEKAAASNGSKISMFSTRDTEADISYLLDIIYLADKQGLANAAGAIPASVQASWKALSPMTTVVDEPDEGAFLIRRLRDAANLPRPAREWAIFRLGDLKEQRAVTLLKDVLIGEYDWTVCYAVKDALISVRSPEVESEMLKLLTHKDENRVRRMAIEVLFSIQGPRGADLARRMLREDNFGLKSLAMGHLSTFGTADDIPLLLPYCDYWKADRATHYWATQAVASIRDRCNCDVNGSIVKAPKTKPRTAGSGRSGPAVIAEGSVRWRPPSPAG